MWALTATTTGLAIVAYVLSRTVGMPQMDDDIGNWAEPLGLLSLAAEGLTLLLAGAVLLPDRRRDRHAAPAPPHRAAVSTPPGPRRQTVAAGGSRGAHAIESRPAR